MKAPAPTIKAVRSELAQLSDAEVAVFLQRYFKTEPGGYGEGDRFRGIRVPALRRLARKYADFRVARQLIESVFHEDRLLALLILVRLFSKADEAARREIYHFYLANTRFINNWDLVDTSAEFFVGPYLAGRSRKPLHKLAQSENLWERRIAILATFHFIRQGDFADTFRIIEQLMDDPHDLIHKAAGWMLREIGNRNLAAEEAFLQQHYKRMPRTMLRYAIEKFPPAKRPGYLKGTVLPHKEPS